jgi:hypothetical protein
MLSKISPSLEFIVAVTDFYAFEKGIEPLLLDCWANKPTYMRI